MFTFFSTQHYFKILFKKIFLKALKISKRMESQHINLNLPPNYCLEKIFFNLMFWKIITKALVITLISLPLVSLSLSLTVLVFVHLKKAQRSGLWISHEGEIQVTISGLISSRDLVISWVQLVRCNGVRDHRFFYGNPESWLDQLMRALLCTISCIERSWSCRPHVISICLDRIKLTMNEVCGWPWSSSSAAAACVLGILDMVSWGLREPPAF